MFYIALFFVFGLAFLVPVIVVVFSGDGSRVSVLLSSDSVLLNGKRKCPHG